MDSEKKSELLERRRNKLSEIKSYNINLFPNDYKVVHSVDDIRNIISGFPETNTEDDTVFSVAGRIMAMNSFGKSSFIRFKDRSGQFQAYIRKDKIGDDSYKLFKQLDIGDYVGLKGSLFKTKTGEWTLFAFELRLVCKAIRPLPEKFHGLKDTEKRYRQRYLDLIMNQNVRDIFVKRSQIIRKIRNYFLERDYIEAETPMMQQIPGGAEATPFKTHHNALGIDLFLRIAPELYLKRLVVGGFERVFEINRNFRNEGVSTHHNPEFTMLEFYEAYATYQDLMDLTENLFSKLSLEITGSTSIVYQGNSIDFSGKWKRISLLNALEEFGGVDPSLIKDKEKLLNFAYSKGIKITKADRIGKIITKLFDALVQDKLIQPTFITEYPVEVSPLSRRNDKDPSMTDRFELFIAGCEIANGFSELNDPEDQKNRFIQQLSIRQDGDEEAHFMDEDYIEALEYGMPPTAGEGIGIDRLTMLFTDSASIREVILFPHMKPAGQKSN
ncbi:lysine--tRNA ligase [Desulfobacterium sp. N47]|uniref:Lysine--tRNA ligase n=1 Tax=uncultured Desulfobacterium sp. TaxID=201089 RepID=E1YF93_9BACT|nr:Lysyl-tRNA synthetase [uncultured Desulfobacterium sp.]